MNISVINKNSYGGEIISISNLDNGILKLLIDDGIKIKYWESNTVSFLLTEVSKINSNRLSQEIIDLIELEGDYDININLLKKKL